ncbi:MAG TPA: extensin-like protein [Myxococcaceae bacterium]
MKKAFDQNVSRAKPRLKLGGPTPEPVVQEPQGADEEWVYEVAAQVAGRPDGAAAQLPTAREVLAAAAQEAELDEVTTRSRVEATLREAAEPVREEEHVTVAVGARARGATAASSSAPIVSGPASSARRAEPPPSASRATTARAPATAPGRPAASPPPAASASRAPVPVAPPRPGAQAPAQPERRPAAPVRTETVAPPAPVAVQARRAAPPAPVEVDDTAARRERLRERLRGVRENPRPEPLPTSVAAAGVLAVERIAHLQVELNQMKQLNGALQHDLDVARRSAERATEEARGRVEEARRLAVQMEERAGLLAELERELQSVEGERDEALIVVQDTRAEAGAEREQRERLTGELARKDAELADSLSEEERLAGELERFRDDSAQLKKSVELLSAERDTLARQVADLTAERAELLDARKALESVHRALTEAARR